MKSVLLVLTFTLASLNSYASNDVDCESQMFLNAISSAHDQLIEVSNDPIVNPSQSQLEVVEAYLDLVKKASKTFCAEIRR